MSIAILTEVYNETRRLAIAGSGLASGDFRLKKLIAPLEKAETKAPVFGKVAGAIENVVESNNETSARALLELGTLVTAILYTQGKTGADGKLKSIETSELCIPTANSSARVLKPLIEALTTTGSGRTEIIEDAFERGVFKDLRLVKPARAAIDDVYGEIGDFVCDNVLPLYGQAILPKLRASFDVKGKAGHVRRLKLLHKLDPGGTGELVETALESGSKEMKIAAISCIKDSKSHLPYMLEQAGAKAKDVRRAAFCALARFTGNNVVDSFIKALSGADVELAAGPVSENRSPRLLKYMLEEGQRQLDAIQTLKDKAKLKKALTGFYRFLLAFNSREDKQSIKFLIGCFEQRDAIGKLKGAEFDGASIIHRVVSLLVRSNDKTAQAALVNAHETLPPECLCWAFVAAMRTCSPKKVYSLFSPYYLATPPKKRGKNPIKEKQDTIRDTLCEIASGRQHRRYYDFYHDLEQNIGFVELTTGVKIDPAWLNAAVASEDMTVVHVLAKPKHKGTVSLLEKTMDQNLAKSGATDHECAEVLNTMIRIGHPKAVDYFLKALEKAGKRKDRYYYAWWLLRLIPDLPKSAVSKIEAILPSMNEKIIDEVIPHLEELKAK